VKATSSAPQKIARDITERRQAEAEHAHLAAIVESSDDAIISKTLESIIMSWNNGAERMFGHTAAEAIGQSIYLIIPPERHDEEQMILDKLRRGERIEHFETVRMRKDGQRLDISLSISPIKNGRGQITGASKIARDITERKRAEQQLAFLAQASELLASSLDYETTLKSLARLAVPQFGDWCAVDIVRNDLSIQRVAIAHLNPAKIALAEEFQRSYLPDPDAPIGVPKVLRTGQPSFTRRSQTSF
jgi:PAS domain S-box-containing protein